MLASPRRLAPRKTEMLPPAELPLNQLVPLIVPTSFFETGKWVGPYSLLRAQGLGLTWGILMPQQTMRYVDKNAETLWNGQSLDWKRKALENLAAMSPKGVATSQFNRQDGSVYAYVMMQEDGLGPSRLLLKGWFARVFPSVCTPVFMAPDPNSETGSRRGFSS